MDSSVIWEWYFLGNINREGKGVKNRVLGILSFSGEVVGKKSFLRGRGEVRRVDEN